MTKDLGRKQLSLAASKKNYEVQVRESVKGDEIRVLSAGKVVATGLLELDASKKNYKSASVAAMLAKINASRKKLNSASNRWWRRYYDKVSAKALADYTGMDISDFDEEAAQIQDGGYGKVTGYLKAKPEYEDSLSEEGYEFLTLVDNVPGISGGDAGLWGGEGGNFYFDTVDQDMLEEVIDVEDFDASRKMNCSRRCKKLTAGCHSKKRMNSGCHSRKKINSADEDPEDGDLDLPEEDADFQQDDADFVEDVESIVTDEDGNEIVVDDMLIVQNPDTNEISIFIPTEDDDQVPENVEVIGEVTATTDDQVLDSARRLVASRRQKNKRSLSSARKKSLNSSISDVARYFLDRGYTDNEVWKELDEEGYADDYIQNVIDWMNELAVKDDSNLNSATRTTTPPLTPEEEDKVKALFDQYGVVIESTTDDTNSDDGVLYDEYVVMIHNPDRKSYDKLMKALDMLETEYDIGYWNDYRSDSGDVRDDIHFFHYPKEGDTQ